MMLLSSNCGATGLRRCFRFVIPILLVTAQYASAADPAGSTPKPPETPAQVLVSQAKANLEKSEWDLAIQAANKSLELDPNGTGAFVARGMAWNGKGEYDKAIADFDLALKQTNRDSASAAHRADAYANRSASLYQQGDYLKAVDNAYFALLEKGDHVEAHVNRALAYIARKQYDKAVQSSDRAIQANPKSAEGYSIRGYAYWYKGNFDQAINDENKAIELQPGLAVAFQRRAAAHFSKKELPKAQADLDKALALKPDFVEALCDQAYLIALSGDMNKVKQRLYILADGWDPSPFRHFAAKFEGQPGWRVTKLACSHDAMVDMPQELARELMAFA